MADIDVDKNEIRLQQGRIRLRVEVMVQNLTIAAPVSPEVQNDPLVLLRCLRQSRLEFTLSYLCRRIDLLGRLNLRLRLRNRCKSNGHCQRDRAKKVWAFHSLILALRTCPCSGK